MRIHSPCCLLALLLAATTAAADVGPVSFPRQPSGRFGLAVSPGFVQPAPAAVVVRVARDKDHDELAVSAGYDHVTPGPAGRVTATATVTTPNGSRFDFTDTWTADRDGAARLARAVAVVAADGRDVGFDTRFGLRPTTAARIRDVDGFLPGVWYRQNDHVVPHAIGADPTLGTYLVKETRLALPLAMLRPRAGGPSLTLVHADAHPSTGCRDGDPGPQTDASIQYGSIGFTTDPVEGGVTVAFCYPGTEGARSYGTNGWRRRWHPVRAGFGDHRYDLLVRPRPAAADFPTAMTDAWQYAFAAYAPVVRPAPSTAIYHEGLAVFDRYYRDDFAGGGRGLPFMVWLGLHPPRGRDVGPRNPTSGRGVSDYHLQSGFVGQQVPAAYLRLRQALLDHDAPATARWASVIDFWANNSLSPAGVPRTDYFCERADWGTGPSFLRTLTDGVEGVVDAYRVRPDPRWLAFARRVGDWLLANQAPDGSWARSYNPDGSVANPGQFNTTNPLRLLVKLSVVTGDPKYQAAAVRGGQWCLAHIDAPALYVGGTSDNDNTIDKEAGVMALYGFQALYDATGERRWLAAAVRAADFAETWTYAWSYPAAANTGLRPGVRSPWPACGLVGQSLVATGHSYADMFMAFCSTPYYRLSLETGDDHYRAFARLLADGANRPADVTGALHYPDRGEIEEGVSPADFVAAGVGTCLTWCTVAQVRPIADLQDLFGCDRIDDVEGRLSPEQRQQRNRNWFPRPPAR